MMLYCRLPLEFTDTSGWAGGGGTMNASPGACIRSPVDEVRPQLVEPSFAFIWYRNAVRDGMAVDEPQMSACEHSCDVVSQVDPVGQSALALHGAPGAMVYQLTQFCSRSELVAVRSSIIG